MKKVILKFRKENKDIFDAIRRGEKSVETRAATSKYRSISAGDILNLVCGSECFDVSVCRATIFTTIEEMLRIYDIKKIVPAIDTPEELRKIYYSFPGYKEKIEQFGLIALELK